MLFAKPEHGPFPGIIFYNNGPGSYGHQHPTHLPFGPKFPPDPPVIFLKTVFMRPKIKNA